VYGNPRLPAQGLITEDEPHGQRLGFLDHYCRAKQESEKLVREYGPDVTIIRPSWIFGPRDRNSFPRLVMALRAGWVSVIGSGDNLLNIVYAGDVAEGAIQLANHPGARGQAYHLSSPGVITQREFLDRLTDALGRPRITRHYSQQLAMWGGLLAEVIARVFRWKRSPHATQYGARLLTRTTRYSIARAQTEVGWQPKTSPQEGLRRTLEWFLQLESPSRSPEVNLGKLGKQ
jgi:nucleoside-diphosphate-sugar epimerase